jgi:hypothetical protein
MMDIEKKNHYIELFRNAKFNCFPIPTSQKVADFRYKASKTVPNQIIKYEENYGILPTAGSGNCIVDLDNKEHYRKFAEFMIKEGFLIVESPHGWHMPVVDLGGAVSKIELFDYNIQPKKIVEIQGYDHYCVGAESMILDTDDRELTYTNRGSDKIWSGSGRDFHDFVDTICQKLKVESRKKNNNSSYQNLRDRFREGGLPTKGSSNDYFHQAAIACNTDGISIEEARDKIKVVYHKWTTSDNFSNRPWENIESKITEVYDKNQVTKTGRPEKEDDNKPENIARKIVSERNIYSDVDTDEIFENRDGFLELINHTLVREMLRLHPEMTQTQYNDVLFKLKGYSDEIPPTNKNYIVFKNGILDKSKLELVKTKELADMGFRDYSYLPKGVENEPTKFMKVLFDDTPIHEMPRIKAGLRSIFINYLDPKISVLYGNSGVGKSTPLLILVETLGNQYALSVELNQFLEDKFIRAKIMGMRLLVFQDLPREWKDFTTLKTLTGEQKKTERGFMKDSVTFDNKLKIWASGNYLAKIPEFEQDAMYTRRLSLIHNIRKTAHKEDPTFSERIVAEEGEKIISWILNFDDSECLYEDKDTVQEEWEETASPEIAFLNKFYQLSDTSNDISVMKIVKNFQERYQQRISIDQMAKTLKTLGYAVRNNIISNIEEAPVRTEQKEEQVKID